MPEYKIKESFRWMAAPEFQIVDTGKHTVTIKGIAVRKGQVSRNKRKYVGEELQAAARTFIGRPVTINHAPYEKSHPMYDGRKVAGHVDWMEYEDGCMEYRAKVNKQPYVDLIRSGSVEVKGVSIEADYLFNRCSHCGADFYTVEEFSSHMENEHFIKNFDYEPRGMLGKALSIVLSPEEPGVPDTTLELAETAGYGGFSQLLETVIKTKKEKTLKKTTKPKKTMPYRTKRIVEQEEDHGCAEDEHWNGEKCVKNEPVAEQEEDHGCAEDEHWDGEKCVKNEGVAEQQQEDTIPLEAPQAADITSETPEVVAPEVMPLIEPEEALPPPPLECGDGFHLEGGECVPDEEVTAVEPEAEMPPAVSDAPSVEPTAVAIEVEVPKVRLPRILRLGEPFADYSSFDDCVAKNPDKDDPAAYCADIKGKVEGETVAKETAPSKDVYARLDMIHNLSKRNYRQGLKRDSQIAESVNLLNRAVAKLTQALPTIPKAFNKPLKALAYGSAQVNKNIAAELDKLSKQDKTTREYVATKVGQAVTAQAKANAKTLREVKRVATAYNALSKSVNGKLLTLTATQKELAESIAVKTKDFEKILAVADRNAAELLEHNKTLEQRVKEMEAEKTATEKKVTETTKLMTRLENLEHAVKKTAEFKGKSKPLEQAESGGEEDKLGEETPYK